ncbi:acyltransferase family protein [Nonomuraea longispora]|nr:acyltransferase [Nonomuraea longispora]
MRDLTARIRSARRGPMRDLVARIDAATPVGRDRALDALRALAILGVVAGHWMVTALVVESGSVRVTSPLRHLPELAPLSWVFQALAVFFLVGGLVASRSHLRARTEGVPYGRWLAGRVARLFRPAVAVLTVWTGAALVMLAVGARLESVQALVKLVLSPMWFLLVFAALTAATPLVSRVHPAWPLAVVVCADLVRYGGLAEGPAGGLAGGPLWWVSVAAGWLVPYCLGATWARGRMQGRATGWTLLLGGGAAAVALVGWGGYPAAMVGVPGAPLSNLDPPSLAAATFGLAQSGAALLLLGPLRRLLRRPGAWAAVALANLAAMTIFLWHQTALIAVSAIALFATESSPLTGLHTVPDGPGWVLARVAWLPVFAVALLVCCAAFHAHERVRPPAEPVARPPRAGSS